ncbi:MAG: DUF222 domain-containing protein [Frankiales bacterium]|nr:DUF222 domain-containing protein [Frankiales bacterium]
MPDAVANVRAALDLLAAVDPTALADASLFAGLSELLDIETTLRAVETRWLAVADTRDTTVAIAGRATRSWLIEECNLGARDAGARLRLARMVGTFPAVEKAFTAARLTADQAFAVVNALVEVPYEFRDTMESLLIEHASTSTPFGLARLTETLLTEFDVESGADRTEARRQRRLAQRGVDLDATFEGAGSLAGTLTPDVYDALRVALDAIDPRSARAAEDERTPRQRRHDALGALARYYLDNAETVAAVNGERPRIVVTMSAAELLTATEATAKLDSGLPVAPEAARRLACDAQLLPVVVDTDGDVLHLGRTTRVWSVAQRRAAWIRDEGRCVFPKCRRPPADLHHLVWWSHGGRTDLDNAAWLCAFHHWLVHDAGWRVRRTAGKRYVFTAPDGREICTHPPPEQPQAA